MAQRCVHDPVPGSSLHRCLSRPGAIDLRMCALPTARARRGWVDGGAHRGPARGIPTRSRFAVRRFPGLGPDTPQPAPRRSQGLRLCSRAFARRCSRRRRRAIAAASASSRRYARKCSGWAAIQTSGSGDSKSTGSDDKAVSKAEGSRWIPGWCQQEANQPPQQPPPSGPDVMHELEEAQVQRQALLGDPPMGPEPRTQQRPEPFERVDVHLAETIPVVVAGVFARRVADRLVAVAPPARRL